MPSVSVSGSSRSSWSVASISTSSLNVSTGAPLSRIASVRSPPCPPDACACSVRVSVSGLYWKTTMLASGLNGSMPTMAPFITFGALCGNELLIGGENHLRRSGPPDQRTRELAVTPVPLHLLDHAPDLDGLALEHRQVALDGERLGRLSRHGSFEAPFGERGRCDGARTGSRRRREHRDLNRVSKVGKEEVGRKRREEVDERKSLRERAYCLDQPRQIDRSRDLRDDPAVGDCIEPRESLRGESEFAAVALDEFVSPELQVHAYELVIEQRYIATLAYPRPNFLIDTGMR